jgi:hypothetical protein
MILRSRPVERRGAASTRKTLRGDGRCFAGQRFYARTSPTLAIGALRQLPVGHVDIVRVQRIATRSPNQSRPFSCAAAPGNRQKNVAKP